MPPSAVAEVDILGMDYLPQFKQKFKGFKIRKSFKENIDPEEILLDAEKPVDLQDQKLETPLRAKVFIIFFGIIIVGLSILLFRAGYLQVFKNEVYLKLANRNSLRVYPILAPRGLIYDKNYKTLVNNLPSYNVFLTPQDLPKSKIEREEMIEKISLLLGLDIKEVEMKVSDFDFEKEQRILLVDGLPTEKILSLEACLKDFPALSLENGIQRQYLYGEILSHILGYTGKLSEKNLKTYPDYFPVGRIGQEGLELQYEKFLKGQDGQREVEVNSRGQQIKEKWIRESISGKSIVTTIDLDLQKKIYEEMKKMLSSLNLTSGVAVALNPKNSQVMALLSLPSYDDNLFEKNISAADFEKLRENPDRPLFNRVISGQYPPGSVIKPMIGAAALEENIVKPTTTVFDPGQITIVNPYNPSVVYNFPDWKAHGIVNIYSAIAQSCDVYFYTIGGGYGSIEGLGIDRIKKYLNLFGFGSLLEIDLPGEKAGLTPDGAWKQEVKNESWYIGDSYHISIGQGDLLVTPLQIATAIASVANGGKLYAPYLVDKIVDSDKNNINVFEPHLIRDDFIKTENLTVVRQGMRQAVTEGSARLLADLSVKAAGKTGTAQISGQKNTNAWFVGFAPYDDPQIVLLIMLENAGEGSSFAVPVAKEVFKYYFSR
ncbi:MAG: penicillin-binding protein 2 [Candidatus Portnoybacteria bacterium RBG_19FT_COMBO_36_7]|uniref:Penicillin-binding protein 2 n=1 Tax=Candidatus Portnoybacteria bacterium RBG_19FT_COMBO_36_7 TaxID=1801992 RepID=A0A1G2F8P8_9BACT|nr:MAG: penicillin-binding protein 2 [Candidatus Portnoybacteria bacterium RBG_19FT_COMBO_36_7]